MHPLSLLKMLLESIGNVVFYCSLKSLFVKRKRFGSDILWIILGSLKTLYRSYDSLRRLLIKEHAHNAFLHMFHNIPSSIRDERPPRCHRLDSHDTKILFLRKHEPAALGIKLRQVLFRYAPKEFDRRPSHFFQTLHFRSTPDDFERQSQPIERFNRLRLPLKIIGRGPEMERLKKMAGPTIEFLGRVPEEDLPKFYAECRGFVFPQEEDFGIVAIEAMASGRPLIAYRGGDIVEHMEEGVMGVFFDEQTPEAIVGAMGHFRAAEYDPQYIRAKALPFDKERFKATIKDYITNALKEHLKQR